MNSERHYPEFIEMVPLNNPVNVTMTVPGSRSIANRALILGALCEPGVVTELRNVPDCDDVRIMMEALRELGFKLAEDPEQASVHIGRAAHASSPIPARSAQLFLGDSGTCLRFLTAMVSLGRGEYELDGSPRLRKRPMAGLLDALRQFGVRVRSVNEDGFAPIEVHGGGSIFSEPRSTQWSRGSIQVQGRDSSQFLSALLMVAPLAQSSIELQLDGPLVSEPYVRMTIDVMRSFGVLVGTDGASFWIDAPSNYDGGIFEIEPDATSAGYFFAAAAIDGGRVTILDLHKDRPQGDIRFAEVLQDMGARVDWCEAGLTVHGRPLHGIEADMNDISDCVPTLAAVACFADGPTTIRNVAHIRHKESDRIAALAAELRKVGADVEEFPDGLKISPRPLHAARIDTHNDHRIAMSMALIGLEVPGIIINDPGCVAKTYPAFWDDLERLWN